MFEMKMSKRMKVSINEDVNKLTDNQAKHLLARYAKAVESTIAYEDKIVEVVCGVRGHKHHRICFCCELGEKGKKDAIVIDAIDFMTDELYKSLLKKLIAYVNADYQFTKNFLKFGTIAELELILTARGL